MIIDITSINNYQDINVIHSLAKSVDPSRVILLLNNDPIVNSQLYRSELVKDGFYNVTSNYEGITYLYNLLKIYYTFSGGFIILILCFNHEGQSYYLR